MTAFVRSRSVSVRGEGGSTSAFSSNFRWCGWRAGGHERVLILNQLVLNHNNEMICTYSAHTTSQSSSSLFSSALWPPSAAGLLPSLEV